MKKALVVRLGAYGDIIMLTPLLRKLKEDGYHITLNMHKGSHSIVRRNSNIDEFMFHDESIPNDKLLEHWESLKSGYDKFVNLSGSIEGGLLAIEGGDDFKLSHDERHKRFNVNYYDRTMEIGGYPDEKGVNGELFFSKYEHSWAQNFRARHGNKFLILWALSGSSPHKTYPYAEYVAIELQNSYPDIVILTVGGVTEKLLEWEHRQTKNYCDDWHLWRSLIMTQYADLVIAPETGVLNAAGCFDTPKIAMLSHSSEENLTKHFKNCDTVHGDVDCYPCHRLIYSWDVCERNKVTNSPICMAGIKPAKMYKMIEKNYFDWKEKWQSQVM